MKRSVLITGASKGIGRAIALKLAIDYDVVVHFGRDREGAEKTATAINSAGGTCRILQCDVKDREQSQAILSEDMEKRGAYYGMVCNAGIHKDAPLAAVSGEDWDAVIRTNLDGFYNTLHPILMPMIQKRQGGRIVAITSISGLAGNRGQASYAASKAGVVAACKSLAIELATRKITVNCVAPGLIETAMLSEAVLEKTIPLIPMQRCGTGEEVAAVVQFLMSDAASYVTKQVISVDGGLY